MNEIVLSIKKTTFVRAGGRNFQFAVLSLVKRRKNFFFGKGKSKILKKAIIKSFKNKKSIYDYNILKDFYYFKKKYSGTILEIIPESKFLLAGGILRKIFFNLGVNNIICKNYGSNNCYNIIKILGIFFNFLKNVRK
ncbi:hypothetical protein [Candidatus Vidania fulgoroideorum]